MGAKHKTGAGLKAARRSTKRLAKGVTKKGGRALRGRGTRAPRSGSTWANKSKQARRRGAGMPRAVHLPCLRCGELAVLVPFLFAVGGRSTLNCWGCETVHYLRVTGSGSRFEVCYQRYTLRHPLSFYDGDDPPVVWLNVEGESGGEPDCFAGPVVIHPRRTRTSEEVRAIWRATNGMCHICRKRKWRLNQRGKKGWHIDHVIPHIGGGSDVEEVANLRVACWKCNLKKGRGYVDAQVRLGLQQLIARFYAGPRA